MPLPSPVRMNQEPAIGVAYRNQSQQILECTAAFHIQPARTSAAEGFPGRDGVIERICAVSCVGALRRRPGDRRRFGAKSSQDKRPE